MAGLTPGKIVILAISVVALGASLFYVLNKDDGVNLANRIYFVDVTTGNLYYHPYGKGIGFSPFIPERHPDSGQDVLFPVEYSKETDTWALNMRYASSAADVASSAIGIDFNTGRFEPSTDPKRIRFK